MASTKPRILFLTDWYLPGYRAGGPIRSISNLVRGLGDEAECMILTTDRDLGDHQPYENKTTNTWVRGEFGEHICYLGPERISRKRITELIIDSGADLVHLNSMFSKPFTIWPLMDKAKGRFNAKVMLAPRGMLAKGSLSIKPLKKKAFLQVFKLKGWHKNITWHAAAEHEIEEIRRVFGQSARIEHLPNFPVPVVNNIARLTKEEGKLKMVCITRIVPVKNIELLLDALSNCTSNIEFDLYGPSEDQQYFGRCQEKMARLPDHIKACYAGEVHPNAIAETLEKYHVYALPTKGENFGHSIFEALATGRPAIISDKTPWNNLGKAGKEVGLENVEEWKQSIDEMGAMDQDAWNEACEAARAYAIDRGKHSELKDLYLKSFLIFTGDSA